MTLAFDGIRCVEPVAADNDQFTQECLSLVQTTLTAEFELVHQKRADEETEVDAWLADETAKLNAQWQARRDEIAAFHAVDVRSLQQGKMQQLQTFAFSDLARHEASYRPTDEPSTLVLFANTLWATAKRTIKRIQKI